MNDLAGLSCRAKKTLFYLGITTKDAINQVSDAELLKYRGCGRKTFHELREWSGYREYQMRASIDAACRKAATFLESNGYTVTPPNKENSNAR